MATGEKRRCYKCGIEKPLPWFPRNKGDKYGRAYQCKKCHREERAQYERDNPDKRRAIRHKHNDKDRDLKNVQASLSHLEAAVEAWDEWDV